MVTIEQLTAQVQLLTQKLSEQDEKIKQMKTTKFELTADQIIRNFNEIPAFSGEDSFKLRSFLKTVEDVEQLCGENNIQLKQYCLKKLINSKIIGKARNAILEIPEHRRNWSTVVETLMLRFRPKQTIHQLLFHAKELKVYNLKDLFNKLTSIKSEASEICDFDNEDNFTYESIDKELVQILKSKLVPLLQIQINQNKTLFELDNSFCQSEIYLSDEVIKSAFRIHKNHKIDNNKVDKKSQLNKRNNDNFNQNHRYNYNANSTQISNNSAPSNNQPKSNFNRNNNNRNSEQLRRPNTVQNKSGQYRNNSNHIEPMEVDNISRENDDNLEVNFTD